MGAQQPERAFIGIGANLDNPEVNVRRAIRALGQMPGTRLIGSSSLYRTTPVGYLDQPEFVNAVAELETILAPCDLLAQLLSIEESFGRRRSTRNAPRTLDLDLLIYGAREISTETLTVPHPRMAERAFVLVPLAEIDPAATVGRLGTAAQLLEAVGNGGVRRIGKADKVACGDHG